MVTEIWISIGSGIGLLPNGTQTINWTNVDFLLMRYCGIYLRAISQEMLKISFLEMSVKIPNLSSHLRFSETVELKLSTIQS